MITNERQYRITKNQAAKFERALNEFKELTLLEQGMDPILIRAQRNALESQLDDLKNDIEAYEKLSSGAITSLSANAIGEVGRKLIEARIAQGLTQKDLAARLGMKEQQIQRYESEFYSSASLNRLTEVASALDVNFQLSLDFRGPEKTTNEEKAPAIDIAKIPLRAIKQRKWLDYFHAPTNSKATNFDALIEHFFQPVSENLQPALLHQGTRLGGKFDEYALLAWQARIVWKARRHENISRPNFGELSWLQSFKEFTLQKDGPALAVEYLRTKGILVLFEGHLPHTHLDGAALLIDDNIFTIGLTLRHDRLDNFWFVLLHELGHIIRHRDSGLRRGFFDDDEAASDNQFEAEADEFAKTLLLPEETWLSSLVRFTQSKEQLIAFAEANRISPAIVAGWIRRERNDYSIFKELVGYGKVKKILKSAGCLEDAHVSGI